jgi:hypothetical protein
MRPSLPARLVAAAALSSLALAGCGASDGSAPTTTVVERVTVQQTAAAPTTENAAADTEASTASEEAAAERAAARRAAAKERAAERRAEERAAERRAERRAAAADCETVPNVVGLENLQVSQDTLQEAGFYLMKQNDATGAGRMQLWDRNWVVVRQSPKGGTCKPLTTIIRTWSKKIGE